MGFLHSACYITDHGQLAGLSDDDHTQYILASGTRVLTGNWLTSAGSLEVQFRATGNRVYSRATDILVVEGNVTTEVGKDGDCVMFGSTLRNFYPSTAGNMQIGTSSNGIADVLMHGNAARTFALNRHSTSNTAGNTLTVKAGGATSGATNKDGGSLVLLPGQSTGTGRAYTRLKGYSTATSSGTSDNTELDREFIGCFKQLTDNSAITICNVTVANGSVAAGILRYAVEVTNGTDYQVEEGMVSFHVTNKAGAIANNVALKFGNQQAVTAGTLTVTFAISAANPALLSVNANSSLTPSTGYPRITYHLSQLTQQAMAIQ